MPLLALGNFKEIRLDLQLRCTPQRPSNIDLQGGAANAPDTLRGYLNEGGLYAERIGAHLPGYPDSSWATGDLVTQSAGVNFFRTTFTTVSEQHLRIVKSTY